MQIRTLILTFVVALTLVGCGQQENSRSPEEKVRVAQGEQLFERHCSECHPRSGRGDYLKRIPATLLARRSEHELVTWIEGRDMHREMPSFTNLSEDQRIALAAFLFDRADVR